MTSKSVVSDGVLNEATQCILFVNEQYALAKRLGVEDLKCVVYPDFEGYKKVFKMLYDSKKHVGDGVIDEAIAKAMSDMEVRKDAEL